MLVGPQGWRARGSALEQTFQPPAAPSPLFFYSPVTRAVLDALLKCGALCHQSSFPESLDCIGRDTRRAQLLSGQGWKSISGAYSSAVLLDSLRAWLEKGAAKFRFLMKTGSLPRLVTGRHPAVKVCSFTQGDTERRSVCLGRTQVWLGLSRIPRHHSSSSRLGTRMDVPPGIL